MSMLILYANEYLGPNVPGHPVWMVLKEQPYTQLIVAEKIEPLINKKETYTSLRIRKNNGSIIKRHVIKNLYEELKYARMFKNDMWQGKYFVSIEEMDNALLKIPLLLATGKPVLKVARI